IVTAGIGESGPGTDAHAGIEAPRQIQCCAPIARQITADTESGAYVLETGVPVAGDMAGDRIVVAETEAFREIALPDPVDIGTDGKGAVEGSIQHLGTNASVHALQQTE